jgi:fission process protein 1
MFYYDKKHTDSTNTIAGKFGYFARFDQLIRYTAYTNDLGEAFRPLIHPYIVRSTYAISWGYVIGDVVYECYNNKKDGIHGCELYRSTTKRAVFQSFASMILPAITIHSTVHYSKKIVFKPYFPKYVKWGPTVYGLLVIPFLPFMFDHFVEHTCNKFFDVAWPLQKEKMP